MINAGVIAFMAVCLFMLVFYRLPGFVACLTLLLQMTLQLLAISIPQYTLTLPGIAGVILSLGMAVDANVLIYERMREELRAGRSPRVAIHEGYDKALSAITDSNVTGMLTALIMFFVGTGPVRGFAVTLSLGVVASIFTAVVVSRLVFDYILNTQKVKTISI